MEATDIITLIGIIITAVLAGANLVTTFFNQRQSQRYNLRMADYERRYVQLIDNVSQYINLQDYTKEAPITLIFTDSKRRRNFSMRDLGKILPPGTSRLLSGVKKPNHVYRRPISP